MSEYAYACFCDNKHQEKLDKFSSHVTDTLKDEHTNIYKLEGKDIAEAYRKITDIVKEKYVILTHVDVVPMSKLSLWMPCVEHLFEKNNAGIVGLAGTDNYRPGSNPLWWVDENKKGVKGSVAHTQGKDFWWTPFSKIQNKFDNLSFYQQVVVCDGLFLILKVEDIDKVKPFDDANGMHMYDMRAGVKYVESGYKNFVINFPVMHHGLGDSMYSEDFKREAERFNKEIRKRELDYNKKNISTT